jgi:hypothetical protein
MSTGTSIGSNQYTFTLASTISVAAVTVNEVDEATWSHTNGVLTVTSASNLSSSSNIVTIDHNIYVTGTKTRYTESISGIPDAEWQPLITEYPQFSQSMRNIAEGVFSLSNSELSLISTNRWGQSLLGVNDSFAKAPISVWVCIDTESTNRKIFDGEVASVSYSYGTLNLSVIDTFSRLKDTASFGTYANSHIYRGSTLAEFPDTEDEQTAAKLTMGKSSPYSLGYGHHPSPIGTPLTKHFHVKDGLKLIKDDKDQYEEGDNVRFFVGRFIGTDLKTLYFGTVTRCYREYSYNTNDTDGQAVYVIIYHVQCSNFLNGEIGDCLPNGLPGVETSACYITYNQNYTGPDGQTYQFSCVVPQFLFLTSSRSSNGLTSNPTLVDNSYYSYCVYRQNIDSINYQIDPGVDVRSKDVFYYLHKSGSIGNRTVNPAVVSLGTLNGQNISALYIDIAYTFPNGLMGFYNINEVNHKNLYCRFSPNESVTHAEALKLIIDTSGMTSKASSFTQADSDLSATVSMTLPSDRGSQFKSYLDAAQSITSSTLGILKVNEDREVEYQILDNPDGLSIDGTRDQVNMISGETNTKIEYQDIFSSVQFLNKELQNLDSVNGTGPKATVSSAKNKQLHRTDKIKTIEHVLESIQNRKDAIAGYFGAPTVEYSLSTSSEDLNSTIGDVIEITNTAVADSDEVVKGIITSLDQRGSKTNVRINEIRGVP